MGKIKKITLFIIIATMLLVFVACGNSKGGSSETKYVVDVAELDPNIYPDKYPLISSDDFKAAFEELKEANMDMKLDGYKDIVDIFGVDGAYYEKCDKEFNNVMYKYYGWYSDDEKSVIITFKADGKKLKYFAWSGNGIN